MYNPETVALRETLSDAPIRFEPERRGFKTRKGVPDAVVWVGPNVAGGPLCVPILFELEGIGGAYDAKRDVSEFAARADDDDHRYHLIWPTTSTVAPEVTTVNVQYDVRVVPSATVTGEYTASEESFYDAVVEWSNQHLLHAQTTTRISRYEGVEVVWWELQTRAFGVDLAIDLPVLTASPEGMTPQEMTSIIGQRATPSLTMFAVIDGRPGSHDYTSAHDTAIELKQLPGHRLSTSLGYGYS